MTSNENEIFKKEFMEKLNQVKAKLARKEKLSDEDFTLLLMSSALEEQG